MLVCHFFNFVISPSVMDTDNINYFVDECEANSYVCVEVGGSVESHMCVLALSI